MALPSTILPASTQRRYLIAASMTFLARGLSRPEDRKVAIPCCHIGSLSLAAMHSQFQFIGIKPELAQPVEQLLVSLSVEPRFSSQDPELLSPRLTDRDQLIFRIQIDDPIIPPDGRNE